jgi:SAM-dependent methyltransferase
MLCGYKGWFSHRPGAIRHVFGLHAYSFQYTALENNPVNRQEASGNLRQLFHDRIVRGRRWAVAPVERRVEPNGAARLVRIPGELDGGVEVFDQTGLAGQSQAFWLIHGDSRRLPVADRSMDFIVTDPPYYDSVQYSDLAAFFRVWLARLLPGELDWTYGESACAVATQTAVEDTGFLAVLSGIFRECGRLLKPGSGRLVFTFHHWDPNAWAELTLALRHAGFRLVNTYVVFSENPISVHIANLNALKHDTILVLALADHAPADRWQPLERIETADSETFCRQCGAALGWLLDSKYTLAEVRYIWKNLVRGR